MSKKIIFETKVDHLGFPIMESHDETCHECGSSLNAPESVLRKYTDGSSSLGSYSQEDGSFIPLKSEVVDGDWQSDSCAQCRNTIDS